MPNMKPSLLTTRTLLKIFIELLVSILYEEKHRLMWGKRASVRV